MDALTKNNVTGIVLVVSNSRYGMIGVRCMYLFVYRGVSWFVRFVEEGGCRNETIISHAKSLLDEKVCIFAMLLLTLSKMVATDHYNTRSIYYYYVLSSEEKASAFRNQRPVFLVVSILMIASSSSHGVFSRHCFCCSLLVLALLYGYDDCFSVLC